MNNAVDQATLNAFGRLEYHDPTEVLRNFRRVEIEITLSTPDPVKHLRTNSLKRWRECREAALFCYGMSCRCGQPISFASDESADHDFVAAWVLAGVRHFAPVQLKELVPEQLNEHSTIDHLVQGLAKYRSDTLTVAVHLNRRGTLEPSTLRVPSLRIAALWFFWGAAPDQSKWCLFGDVLNEPALSSFAYPT
jgi:hypothetical protein